MVFNGRIQLLTCVQCQLAVTFLLPYLSTIPRHKAGLGTFSSARADRLIVLLICCSVNIFGKNAGFSHSETCLKSGPQDIQFTYLTSLNNGQEQVVLSDNLFISPSCFGSYSQLHDLLRFEGVDMLNLNLFLSVLGFFLLLGGICHYYLTFCSEKCI